MLYILTWAIYIIYDLWLNNTITKHYSAIKNNEILSFASKCMQLEIFVLSEISHFQKTNIFSLIQLIHKVQKTIHMSKIGILGSDYCLQSSSKLRGNGSLLLFLIFDLMCISLHKPAIAK